MILKVHCGQRKTHGVDENMWVQDREGGATCGLLLRQRIEFKFSIELTRPTLRNGRSKLCGNSLEMLSTLISNFSIPCCPPSMQPNMHNWNTVKLEVLLEYSLEYLNNERDFDCSCTIRCILCIWAIAREQQKFPKTVVRFMDTSSKLTLCP